jgi:Arc/MetJ family transcription regulator
VTKTLIDIPDDLLAEAMATLGVRTKAEAVRLALAIVTRQKRQRDALGWIVESGALADLNDHEIRAAARR